MFELNHITRALAIHLINPQTDKEKSIHDGEELESLINTLGLKIVDRIVQKLDHPNNKTYIGKGKIEEVINIITKKGVDVVILNDMVRPGQIHALKEELKRAKKTIEVWDRVDLILHIFESHASTIEAKLQIKLARMNYMGPRIYGMGAIMSRQGGGIGTLGTGETNTELMKRHWRNEKKKITDQLEKISRSHEQHIERRKRAGFKTVSVVGYTNAGKSSLFNSLSKKGVLARDELFATLDSSVSKLYIPDLHSEVLVTDTIGFIRDLPPLLVNAFKSTLLETLHSNLLLHVIDIADPEVDSKIKIVNTILEQLGADQKKIVFVFNKIDAASINKEEFQRRYEAFSPIFISVKNGEGISGVIDAIKNKLIQSTISPYN